MSHSTTPEGGSGQNPTGGDAEGPMDGKAEAGKQNQESDRGGDPKRCQGAKDRERSSDDRKRSDHHFDTEDRIGHQPVISRSDRSSFWTMLATAFLAIATFGLAIATFDMARSTRHLAELADRQAQDTQDALKIGTQQAAAATQKATTMEKQLSVFKGQLEAANFSQRPSVRIIPNPAPFFDAKTGKIVWNVNYINVGLHDAISMSLEGGISIGGSSFVSTLKASPQDFAQGNPAFSSVRSKDSFTEPQYQEILSRDLQIRVFVEILYKDDAGKGYIVERCWGHLANGAIANLQNASCKAEKAIP